MIPDVTRRHWSVNIPKYVVRATTLDELVGLGSVTPHAAVVLQATVRAGLNVLVSGGTQARKAHSQSRSTRRLGLASEMATGYLGIRSRLDGQFMRILKEELPDLYDELAPWLAGVLERHALALSEAGT